MSAHEVTQRETGFGGTAHCGATAEDETIYNSADIKSWNWTADLKTVDASGLNDVDEVDQAVRRARTGNISKMVAGSDVFVDYVLSNPSPVVYLKLLGGSNIDATPGEGRVVDEGWARITRVGRSNRDGEMSLEDVDFKFQGASSKTIT